MATKKAPKTVAPSAPSAVLRTAPAPADDLDKVRELVRILEGSTLSELSYEDAAIAVKLSRQTASAPVAAHAQPPLAFVPTAPMSFSSTPASAPAAAEEPVGHVIRSPFVGTFYRSPSPEAASFTEIGREVKKGQTLCIVEAMKLMNEIECDVDGKVIAVLVENGKTVQFNDPLFRIAVKA
jgi:acetyl-CoA carboxylase biotin carboxyl carrier protein